MRGDVPPASRASIRSAGPFIARPPTSGLTATHGTRRCSSPPRISPTARIGPILMNGLLGRSAISSAPSIASRTPGAGTGRLLPDEADGSTSSRCPRATNHSWNGNPRRRVDPGAKRRPSPAAAASRGGGAAQAGGQVGERLAGAKSLGPNEMQTDVPVAELEPRSPPSTPASRTRPTSRPLCPSRARRRESRQGVEDAVEVGGDVQAEHLDVVADVADHGDPSGVAR